MLHKTGRAAPQPGEGNPVLLANQGTRKKKKQETLAIIYSRLEVNRELAPMVNPAVVPDVGQVGGLSPGCSLLSARWVSRSRWMPCMLIERRSVSALL